VPTSKERLCTTCGGTTAFLCGSFAFANPTVTCDFSDGNYSMDLSIESDSIPGTYQAIMSPKLPFGVLSGVAGIDCNMLGDGILAPDEAPNDINNNQIDDNSTRDDVIIIDDEDGITANPQEQPVTYLFQLLTQNMPPFFKGIIAMMLILGTAILSNNRSNGNPVITVLGAIGGAGLGVILGVISIEIAIMVFIAFIIGGLLYFHFTKGHNGVPMQ